MPSQTSVPGVLGFAVTFGSSVYTPGYGEVMSEFDISSTLALLGLSMWVLGLAFGPVLAAPVSRFPFHPSFPSPIPS